MTDEQLERLVSETIEPLTGCRLSGHNGTWTSKNGYWSSGPGYDNKPPLEKLKPAPWLTDDNYTMRLFDEMPAGQVYFQPVVKVWIAVADAWQHGYQYKKTEDLDRRKAIVLAWCKWKGVPIES